MTRIHIRVQVEPHTRQSYFFSFKAKHLYGHTKKVIAARSNDYTQLKTVTSLDHVTRRNKILGRRQTSPVIIELAERFPQSSCNVTQVPWKYTVVYRLSLNQSRAEVWPKNVTTVTA
jgi:hypothetical protein